MMFPPDIERHGKALLLAVIFLFILKYAWLAGKALYSQMGG